MNDTSTSATSDNDNPEEVTIQFMDEKNLCRKYGSVNVKSILEHIFSCPLIQGPLRHPDNFVEYDKELKTLTIQADGHSHECLWDVLDYMTGKTKTIEPKHSANLSIDKLVEDMAYFGVPKEEIRVLRNIRKLDKPFETFTNQIVTVKEQLYDTILDQVIDIIMERVNKIIKELKDQGVTQKLHMSDHDTFAGSILNLRLSDNTTIDIHPDQNNRICITTFFMFYPDNVLNLLWYYKNRCYTCRRDLSKSISDIFKRKGMTIVYSGILIQI